MADQGRGRGLSRQAQCQRCSHGVGSGLPCTCGPATACGHIECASGREQTCGHEEMVVQHDKLLTMLADLARRNDGSLTFDFDRLGDPPALPFEFFVDDDARTVTFRVYE